MQENEYKASLINNDKAVGSLSDLKVKDAAQIASDNGVSMPQIVPNQKIVKDNSNVALTEQGIAENPATAKTDLDGLILDPKNKYNYLLAEVEANENKKRLQAIEIPDLGFVGNVKEGVKAGWASGRRSTIINDLRKALDGKGSVSEKLQELKDFDKTTRVQPAGGFVTESVSGAVASLPIMGVSAGLGLAASVGAATVTGGASLIPSIFGSLTAATSMFALTVDENQGGIYEDLIRQGYDHETASPIAGTSGTISSLIETTDVLGGVGGIVLRKGKALAAAGKKVLKKKSISALSDKPIKQLIKEGAKTGLDVATREGTQEFFQEGSQAIVSASAPRVAEGMTQSEAIRETLRVLGEDLESGELSPESSQILKSAAQGALGGVFLGGSLAGVGTSYKALANTRSKAEANKILKKIIKDSAKGHQEISDADGTGSADALVKNMQEAEEIPRRVFLTDEAKASIIENTKNEPQVYAGVIASLGLTIEQFENDVDAEVDFVNYIKTKNLFEGVLEQNVENSLIIDTITNETTNQNTVAENYYQSNIERKTRKLLNTNMFFTEAFEGSNLTNDQKVVAADKLTGMASIIAGARTDNVDVIDLLKDEDKGLIINLVDEFSESKIVDGKLDKAPYNLEGEFDESVNGNFTLRGMANIINLFKNHNITTALHESNHWFWKMMFEAYSSDKLNEAWSSDIEIVMEFLGKKKKGGDYRDAVIKDNDFEKLAVAFEKKLLSGKTYAVGADRVTNALRNWFQDIYGVAKDPASLDIDNNLSRVLDLTMYARNQVLTQAEIESYDGVSLDGYKFEKEAQQYLRDKKKAINNESVIIAKSIDKAIISGNTKTQQEVVKGVEDQFIEDNKDDVKFEARKNVIRNKLDRDAVAAAGVNPNDYIGFVTKDPEIQEVRRDDIPFPEIDVMEGLIEEDVQVHVADQKQDEISFGRYIIDRIENDLYVDGEAVDILKDILAELSVKAQKMPEDFVQHLRRNGGLNLKVAKSLDLTEHPVLKGTVGFKQLFTNKSTKNESDLTEMVADFTGRDASKIDSTEAIEFLNDALDVPHYGENSALAAEIESARESKDILTSELAVDAQSIRSLIKKAEKLSAAPSEVTNPEGNLFKLEDAKRGQNPTVVAGNFGYDNFKIMLDEISSIGTIEQEAKKVGREAKLQYIADRLSKDEHASAFNVSKNYDRFKLAVKESRIYANRDYTGINDTMRDIIKLSEEAFNKLAYNKDMSVTLKALAAKRSYAARRSSEQKSDGNIEEAVRLKQEEASYIYMSEQVIKEFSKLDQIKKDVAKYTNKQTIRRFNQKNLFLSRTILRKQGLINSNHGTFPTFKEFSDTVGETVEGMSRRGVKLKSIDLRSMKEILWVNQDVKDLKYDDIKNINYITRSVLDYGKTTQSLKWGEYSQEIKDDSAEMKEELKDKKFKRNNDRLQFGNDKALNRVLNGYGKFFDENFAGAEWIFTKWGETFYRKYFQRIMDATSERDEAVKAVNLKVKALFDRHGISNINFKEQNLINGQMLNKTNMMLFVMNYGREDTYKHLSKTMEPIYGKLDASEIDSLLQEILANMNEVDKDLIDLFFDEYNKIFSLRKEGANKLEDRVVLEAEPRKFVDESTGRKFKGGYVPISHRFQKDFNELAVFSLGGGNMTGEGANHSVTNKKPQELDLENLRLESPLYEAYTYALVLPEAVKASDFIVANQEFIRDKFGDRDIEIAKRYFKDLFYVATRKALSEKFLSKINTAGKIMILGGKAVQVPVQALGFLAAIPNVKGYAVPALANFLLSSPQELYKAVMRKDSERHPYLTERFLGGYKYGLDIIKDGTNPFFSGRINRSKRVLTIIYMAYLGIGDRIASTITFDAAYAQGREELNLNEKDAADYAARTVRLTQGDYGSFAREMAPSVKLFLPFTSYMATQMNQYKYFRETGNKGEMAMFMVFVMFISPVLEDAIKYFARGEDDREDIFDWISEGTQNIFENAAGVAAPGVGGGLARALIADSPWEVRFSTPLTSTVSEFYLSLDTLGNVVGLDGDLDLLDEEEYWDLTKHLLQTIGTPKQYFKNIEKYVLDK